MPSANRRTGNGLAGWGARSTGSGSEALEIVRRHRMAGRTTKPARKGRRMREAARLDLCGGEADADRLLERSSLVVGPHHRQGSLLVGLDREGHDRVLADPRSQLEARHFLLAVCN